MDSKDTVFEKYKRLIKKYYDHENRTSNLSDPTKNNENITQLLNDFMSTLEVVLSLNFFSKNDDFEDINIMCIPFLNIKFYLANLFLKYSRDSKELNSFLKLRQNDLQLSKKNFLDYLELLYNYKLLTNEQSSRYKLFEKNSFSLNEMSLHNVDLSVKRQEKIESYKREKELYKNLKILEQFYDDSTPLKSQKLSLNFDDETMGRIFIDQISLFAINTFNQIESVSIELQTILNTLLSNQKREKVEHNSFNKQSMEDSKKKKDYGYTSRLETLPTRKGKLDFIFKNGVISQPFALIPNRQTLKKNVFKLGHILPTMTVDEYLNYELSTGKLMKSKVIDDFNVEDETDSSESELKKRHWDDWKDENPRGSGNMKSNIG